MFRIPEKARLPLRVLAISMGAVLFAYLVWRAGPAKLRENIVTLGWGFTWVIALTGVSHVARTWAWRITLGDHREKISFSRLFGLRLGAEAAGQLGILGQTFGDSFRVSQLNSHMPMATGLASVTLDRGLYIVTSIMVTIAGILAALCMLSLSHALRLYAALFALALITVLLLVLIAARKRWPVFSGSARVIGRIPALKNWIEKEYLLIQSVETRLFEFHHHTPKAFWSSFCLNFLSHCIAILEVCLILSLMGSKIGFLSALVIEALTKLVNVMGNANPGNIGTYEGGNMLIGKMFGLSGATGLALALTRRLRSLFWVGVGIICLFLLTRPKERRDSNNRGNAVETVAKDSKVQTDPPSVPSAGEVAVAIFVGKAEARGSQFSSPLTRVGSLPILLRTILAAQKVGITQIVVVADPITGLRVQQELLRARRLPKFVQWMAAAPGAPPWQLLRLIATATCSERLVLVDGSTMYHPSLFRKASEWNDEHAALALTSNDKPAGIYALSVDKIRPVAERCPAQIETLQKLDASLSGMHSLVRIPVQEDLWQSVNTPEDRQVAEEKLNGWLVKPTDGIFARTNRRISIPISRQIIKFPITPNMVSIFTLGVGFASGLFFALGGYWNALFGAVLCLFASILDGCDGEVARLKFQESDFGCWLETVCDYVFYLVLFVGMTIGLWRSSGTKTYLVCGGLLFFGAIASFAAVGWERHRLASGRPEQLLRIWQAHAESRPSNPFLYLGRHMEFIVRRCFFPYAILFFAFCNILNVAFILSAIGANLVWPIALYSSSTFAESRSSTVASPVSSA
ncbi:MAG TPA: lysylphosphatidylglycerol synthase domain-containing protein [Candidatus Acidoferrales bacterium]|nr:lysylphosphatidylglycerol synthase domain-containing protein [Candidatus Acidoferrales bacterium]